MIDKANLAGVEERLDHISRLLTALLVKGMSKKDAVLTLSAAGFAPKDVGSMLSLTNQQVSVILYDSKQAATKATKAAKVRAAPSGR